MTNDAGRRTRCRHRWPSGHAAASARTFVTRSLLALLAATLALARPAEAVDAGVTDRSKIGLVLGGGGARGAAHIGALRVLERERIPIDYVAGTSMGAIVGGLYASGLSADEIERLLKSIDWNDAFNDRSARVDRPFVRKRDDDNYQVKREVGFGDDRKVKFPAANQLTWILTARNTQTQIASLRRDDIFLHPKLGDFSAADFADAPTIIPLGEQAAEVRVAKLREHAVGREAYQAYLVDRASRRESTPVVEFVRLENNSKLSNAVIAGRLRQRVGEPLDTKAMDRDIALIYGLGNFESVRYAVATED